MTVAGLRRVSWVSVTPAAPGQGAGVVAEAHGIGHRHPAVVRISLRTAQRLQEAGVPLVVRKAA